MFDSVLDRGSIPKGRFGTGATLSVVAHVALVGLAIYVSSRPHEKEKKDVDVTFFAPAPPPPPPPPPPLGGGSPKPQQIKPRPIKKPDTIVQTKDPEKPRDPDPPKTDPSQAQGAPGGQEGGQVGGTVGGTVGGQIGGQLGGQLGGTVGGTGTGTPSSGTVPFGAGMNRPTVGKPPDSVYTREARVAKVEGVMIVKCVITAAGTVQGCRAIKGLPHLTETTIAWLQTQHMTVTFQGRPVSVEYVFNFNFKMP